MECHPTIYREKLITRRFIDKQSRHYSVSFLMSHHQAVRDDISDVKSTMDA